MHQLNLIDLPSTDQVVNVASVPQRSPFRYPGGKTWLVPQVRRWLVSRKIRPKLLVEPFVGGGIVGLTAAFEDLADKILLVERDERIASVWKAMLEGDGEWLADRILHFQMTDENVQRELQRSTNSVKDIAFATIIRNRVNHGGIMAPGAGVIKFGENGKGIASRWYPGTLAKRIINIARISSRINFIEGDGLAAIREHECEAETVFFVDPPYTAAGKKAGRRLYSYNNIDHESLFDQMNSVRGEFLMTYDDALGVREMAEKHGFEVATVSMSNTHHARMKELLISKNVSWVK